MSSASSERTFQRIRAIHKEAWTGAGRSGYHIETEEHNLGSGKNRDFRPEFGLP